MEYYIHYTSQEHQDALDLDRAVELVQAQKWDEARRLLDPIAFRSPEFYVYSFETDAQMFIKFWTLEEYLGYIGMTRQLGETPEQEIVWLKAAYPRVQHLLSQVDRAVGDYPAAAERLDRALLMEPDHPQCLCDMAIVTAQTGDLERALAYCDMALQARPYLSGPVKHLAQQTRIQLLTELKREDEAHTTRHESFITEIDAAIIPNVEAYRKGFETGDTTAPVGLKLDHLEELGMGPSPYDEIDVSESNSDPMPLESMPSGQGPPVRKKRWWQVWKRSVPPAASASDASDADPPQA